MKLNEIKVHVIKAVEEINEPTGKSGNRILFLTSCVNCVDKTATFPDNLLE